MSNNSPNNSANSSEKDGLAHAENTKATGDKPARRGCFYRYFIRWWWVWLIVIIVVVLVTVLPIIYVAYPHIARNDIDKSRIEVTAETITKPTPDTSYVSLDELFLSNSSQTATLDAFTASLYLEGRSNPFIDLKIPKIQGKNGTRVTISQQINITDQDEYTRYVEAVLLQEEYTMLLQGKGGLKLGGLPITTVNYNKTITSKGLNGLQGLYLESFYLLNETLDNGVDNGINAFGNVSIPNPSVLTLELGDIEMGFTVNGTAIGNATLPNVTLVPGDNYVHMDATVYELVVVGLVLGGAASSNGTLEVQVHGNRTIYDGTVVPYYSDALQQTNLTVSLNVFTAQNHTVTSKRSLPRGNLAI